MAANGGDQQVRVLLLDIEGTTTPVDFVYKTLFPYAKSRVEHFLREHGDEKEVQAVQRDLRLQHERDEKDGIAPPAWKDETRDAEFSSAVAYAQWLMARDSKCTALKVLQGMIWREGYETGELRGEVYPDVPRAFARWKRQGREIAIYSSGSVLAQQLLFRSTADGDLSKLISRFFDTRIGAKTESDSYRKIAASLERAPIEILFVSDAVKEVQAALQADMRATLCQRGAANADFASEAGTIRTFDEIFPDRHPRD